MPAAPPCAASNFLQFFGLFRQPPTQPADVENEPAMLPAADFLDGIARGKIKKHLPSVHSRDHRLDIHGRPEWRRRKMRHFHQNSERLFIFAQIGLKKFLAQDFDIENQSCRPIDGQALAQEINSALVIDDDASGRAKPGVCTENSNRID
jgi:hypothetical protein